MIPRHPDAVTRLAEQHRHAFHEEAASRRLVRQCTSPKHVAGPVRRDRMRLQRPDPLNVLTWLMGRWAGSVVEHRGPAVEL